MKRILFSSVILVATFLFGSCDSLGNDDPPKKDWTVESVIYYPNSSPRLYKVVLGGEPDFNNSSYYYEKDISTPIDFSDIIAIPGLENKESYVGFSYGFVIVVATGGQPTGDAVITYNNTYFYEVSGGDALLDQDWTAEVRIVTKTVPVTVIP
jgi:hypothetical protein